MDFVGFGHVFPFVFRDKAMSESGPRGSAQGLQLDLRDETEDHGEDGHLCLVQLPAAGWMRHDIGFFQMFFTYVSTI